MSKLGDAVTLQIQLVASEAESARTCVPVTGLPVPSLDLSSSLAQKLAPFSFLMSESVSSFLQGLAFPGKSPCPDGLKRIVLPLASGVQ